MLFKILVFLISCHIITGNGVYNHGAFDDSQTYLPCTPNVIHDEQIRSAVWWATEGKPIGQYSRDNGFVASGVPAFQGKFNMDSIAGDLTVLSVDKKTDARLYECGIVFSNGTNSTDTEDVQLEIGNAPSNFHIYTNGDKFTCYEHVGLGPMTCTVLSYPNVTLVWSLKDHGISDCSYALSKAKTTCVYQPDGNEEHYKCSSILDPDDYCYGQYECQWQYVLGQNIYMEDSLCVLVLATDFWSEFYYFLIAIITLILVTLFGFLIIVVLSCLGVVTCSACLTGALCCCCCCHDKDSGWCCCKKPQQVTPQPSYASDPVIVMVDLPLTDEHCKQDIDQPPQYSHSQ